MKKVTKELKGIVKEMLTSGIALNIYLVLCFIGLSICIYNMIDLIKYTF